MRLYARQGRHATALRQYQVCIDVLQRELRAEPEMETRQLYQELLQQRRRGRGHPEAASQRSDLRPRSSAPGERLQLPVHGAQLIGREAELERLRKLARHAEEGAGSVAIILGEAGIGKSRLLSEIASEATERGSSVMFGCAFESEQLLAFGPWAAAVRSSRALEEPGALEALAPAWQRELGRLFPEIGNSVAAIRAGEENHRRLFEALERLFSILAEQRPLILVLEDLHWADDMSLRFLSYLGRRIDRRKVLILASARQEELVTVPALRRAIDELLPESRCLELALGPLSRHGTLDLVRALIRSGEQPSGDLEERIWTASEGNPFMIVQIVRALEQDSDVLPATTVPVPDGVQKLIAGRLDRVGARGQHVTAVAAVIGRDFDFSLLQRAAGLSARDAAEAVEELVRRRVLHGAGERLDFTHDRIRDVAYLRLLPATR
jgi:predicted ATPase